MDVEAVEDAGTDSPSGRRIEVAVAVLIALVAVTAALATWRTSVVGASAADASRTGLLTITKQEAVRNITENQAYGQADYATRAFAEEAAAESMTVSGRPALVAAAASLRTSLIPGLQQLAGPFPAGSFISPLGTLDVPAYITSLQQQDPAYTALVPEASFTLADDYSAEQRWLTVLSVLLAIALFWLGLAEITSGRWRLVNLAAGVALWALCLVGLFVIETTFIAGRGGVL